MPRVVRRLLPAARRKLAKGGVALPAWQLLGLICMASAATIVLLGTRLTFFNDDWYFLLQRPGLSADSVFTPHNGHLSALAVLIYKGLVELFGLESQLPFRLVLATAVASLGILVYLLVRERAGALLGLVAATLVVFLGTAWEDLLWSFQIGQVGSLATGLAVLLALERDTPGRNATACLLLVLSVSLSDLGIPFIVAAGIAVLLRGRLTQLWIPGIPTVLFGIWWGAYGSDAPSNLSAANLKGLPRYLLDSAASGLASITGRGGEGWVPWGYVLLVVSAAGIVVWLRRGRRPAPQLLVFVSAALTFWVAAGANFIPGREPFASRYQLVNVTLLILIAAELFRPIRLSSGQAAGVLGVALVALGLNLDALGGGYAFMRDRSADAKTYIGALEITRGQAAPTFQIFALAPHAPYLTGLTPHGYFEETDEHGPLPAYSPRQIAAAPVAQRRLADHVLVATYDIKPEAAPHSVSPSGCRRGTPEVELPGGGALIRNLGQRPLGIGVGRFAPPNSPVSLGSLAAGRTARVVIPLDPVALPWHLFARRSTIEVCRL